MADESRTNSAEVIVCRCEGVTWGDIQAAMDAFQPTSLRQLKLVTRWGMGICQGRVCRPITAAARFDLGEPSVLAVRPPVKPLTMEQLGGGEDS